MRSHGYCNKVIITLLLSTVLYFLWVKCDHMFLLRPHCFCFEFNEITIGNPH